MLAGTSIGAVADGYDMGSTSPTEGWSRQPSAVPLWFGPQARPLFGWYHPSRLRPTAAVVLCSAFGHEEMAVHRGYLHIAQRLAREGFATLRFDYDGSGNSAGGPLDDERVEAWLSSFALARSMLLELCGAARIILAGARLGSLLALSHAARVPADGMILIGTPSSPKAWVREMGALAKMRQGQLTVQPPTEEPGIVGFALSEETRKELSRLDWASSAMAPARSALIVPRDDIPDSDVKLVSQLMRLGVETTLSKAKGYGDFMRDDPYGSKLPTQILEEAVGWLHQQFGTTSLSPTSDRCLPSARRVPVETNAQIDGVLREVAVRFHGLFGVLSEPSVPGRRASSAIVLLNIGANHHIGSNRMYVHLARRLTALGFGCLRFDFSGIGDSGVEPGGRENDVYSARFFRQVRAAIDFMMSRGVENVVLGGLCSGAYAAFHTATADPRVSGVILINPLTFHWREGDSLEVRIRQGIKSTIFYRNSLRRPETWWRLVRGQVDVTGISRELGKRWRGRVLRQYKSIVAKLTGTMAETTDVERGFLDLCSRGAKCLLIYGSNDGGIDVIEDHLGTNAKRVRDKSNFRMEILEGPDHTFTPLWTQELLFKMVESHMLEHFG